MSEETSSSSTSSLSKNSAQMKRQNSKSASADQAKDNIVHEDTDGAKGEENCKRRKKSGQNNNEENENDKAEIEDDNNVSLMEEGAIDTNNKESLQTMNVINSEGVGTEMEGKTVTEPDPMAGAVSTNATSSNIVSTTGEELEIDVDMSTAEATVVDNTKILTGSKTPNIEMSPDETNRASDGEAVTARNVNRTSSTTTTAADNDVFPLRQVNVRLRRYRRPDPDSSSDSTSPIPASANVFNGEQANDDSDSSSNANSNSIQVILDSLSSEQSSDSVEDVISLTSDLSLPDPPLDMDNDENIGDARPGNSRMTAPLLISLEDILGKPLPSCNFNITTEVMYREHGFSNRFEATPWGQNRFNSRFYASQFVVERIELSHYLERHNGCVNSLNFNRNGNLLCSGSDDWRIVVWDWAHNKVKHAFPSGHKENIFQTKFISSGTELDIVSAGRDGQVRRSIIPPSGKAVTSCLYKHPNAVHKLVICPNSPHEILSVGEDGYIRHSDLRSAPNSLALKKVVYNSRARVRLFSIAHHPYAPEVCVCGGDELVRVFDKRKFEEPVHKMCPLHLLSPVHKSYSQVTCCTYNHNGSEILATYSDEQIYLFDNKNYTSGSYLHVYRGHYNHRTIKGVNFFGPNSEYVISGSDCGNIFFWDKNTEAILNVKLGDSLGVVNCLEPHPSIPVLATSGLDYTVKVWSPGSERTSPSKDKLKSLLKRNIWQGLDGQTNYFTRTLNELISETLRADGSSDNDDSLSEFSLFNPESNSYTLSESSSPGGDDGSPPDGIPCRTQ